MKEKTKKPRGVTEEARDAECCASPIFPHDALVFLFSGACYVAPGCVTVPSSPSVLAEVIAWTEVATETSNEGKDESSL